MFKNIWWRILFFDLCAVKILYPPYTQRGFLVHVLGCAQHTATKRVRGLHLPPTRSSLHRDAWPQTVWCRRRHLCRWPRHHLQECGDWWPLPGWRWEELSVSLCSSPSARPAQEMTAERCNLWTIVRARQKGGKTRIFWKSTSLKKMNPSFLVWKPKALIKQNLRSVHRQTHTHKPEPCFHCLHASFNINILVKFEQLLVFQSEVHMGAYVTVRISRLCFWALALLSSSKRCKSLLLHVFAVCWSNFLENSSSSCSHGPQQKLFNNGQPDC